MDGVFFLMSIIAIVLVAHWVVINDRVAPDRPTRGIFAMRDGRPRRKAAAALPPAADSPPRAVAATPPARRGTVRGLW